MIYLKGNRTYIKSIDKDLWTVWKGFIQHINDFKKDNNNALDLLRDLDIIIGTILEKDNTARDELKEALTGLSILLHEIRVQITKIDTQFNDLNKPTFEVEKEKLEQLVVRARQNLMLVAADLKNVNLSRRKFLTATGKAALGITITAGFGLSLQSDASLLEKIAQALEQDDYEEVKKELKSISVPFTNQVKPTIVIEIPQYLKKAFQKAKQDPQLKEELRQTFIESIKALRNKERFTEIESKNTLTHIHNSKFLRQEGVKIIDKTGNSVGTSIFTQNVINNAIKHKNITIRGLMISVHHGFLDNASYKIYFKNQELLASTIKVISSCREYDLMIYLFAPLFEEVKEKTGVRFTTSLKEGEEVYLLRYPTHPNYAKYGPISKGKVLMYSYYHPKIPLVDLAITTLETYEGDSGSPIFNKNGEVVGILRGGLVYQTTKKKRFLNAFIRSEYVLKLLEETQKFFEKELK